jgi:hypothetical protein
VSCPSSPFAALQSNNLQLTNPALTFIPHPMCTAAKSVHIALNCGYARRQVILLQPSLRAKLRSSTNRHSLLHVDVGFTSYCTCSGRDRTQWKKHRKRNRVGSRIRDHVPLRKCRFVENKRGRPPIGGYPQPTLIHAHAPCLSGRSKGSFTTCSGTVDGGTQDMAATQWSKEGWRTEADRNSGATRGDAHARAIALSLALFLSRSL